MTDAEFDAWQREIRLELQEEVRAMYAAARARYARAIDPEWDDRGTASAQAGLQAADLRGVTRMQAMAYGHSLRARHACDLGPRAGRARVR